MKRAWIVAAALLVATACGGGGSPSAGGSTSPGTANPTARSPSPGTSGGTTKPKPGGSSRGTPKPGKSGVPTPRATSPGGATATLDRTCARRGIDQQGITITTTPGGTAGYTTTYSDGSYAADGHSHYTSGYGGGVDGQPGDPKDGRWSDTWTVPANAPTGIAVVEAVTQQGNAYVSFRIVAQTGHC